MARPGVKPIEDFEVMYNVGGFIDIPTGTLIEGDKGETIVNGGLPVMTGVMGPGNSFKTGFVEGIMLTAADRVSASLDDTLMLTLDTEHNKQVTRQRHLASFYKHIYSDMITDPEIGKWVISDIIDNPGNKWFEEVKSYFKERAKHTRKKNKVPFKTNKNRKIEIATPNFICVDSLSGFEVEASSDILTKHELGASESNMYFMRNGLIKTVFLKELLSLCSQYDARALFTTHIGKENAPVSGPPGMRPAKKLQHMPAGTKGKGISENAYYLASHLWMVKGANGIPNKSNRFSPEYPYSPEEAANGDPNELNLIKILMTRSKTGRSGFISNIIISQDDGLQHDMSNFITLKDNSFGYTMGGKGTMTLDLYPDIKFTRNTVRKELRENPLFARAVEITSDLFLLKWFHPHLVRAGLMCTPAELYADLKDKYKWEDLLNTRSWWTFNQYGYKVPYLSTPDLLKLRANVYTPYWMK